MEDITACLHADKNKPVERGKLILQESAKSLSMQKREWDSKQHIYGLAIGGSLTFYPF